VVQPILSIVIPAQRRPELLRLCLSSVVRYAPAAVEVLVVDDGSPDGVVSRVARAFPGVEVIRRDESGGFCRAANTGVRRARAPVVELLNDDTEVTPGWAESALAAFADARIGAVAPLVLIGPADPTATPRVDSAGDTWCLAGVARKRGHGEPLSARYLRPGPVFGASGSSAFYRRDALLAVGGFPEELGAYFDDIDLACRLHRAGFRVWYEPAARVYHRVSASYGRVDPELLALQSRNEELVFWRNLPLGTLAWAVPLHLAVLGCKAVRRAREGRLLPFLRGRWQALAAWPEVVRHRRAQVSEPRA
jgi:GT2 family glycosyltransferase